MKSRMVGSMMMAGLLLLSGAWACPASAGGGDLVAMLVNQLGVSAPQAEGGAGALFNLARQKLDGKAFGQVTDALPEVSGLLDAAPKGKGGAAGVVGQAAAALGKSGGSMGKLADIAGSFSSLGMEKGMAGKFVPVVLEYAQSKGGPAVVEILKSVFL